MNPQKGKLFEVAGLASRALGFRASDFGVRVWGWGLGLGLVWGLGFRV